MKRRTRILIFVPIICLIFVVVGYFAMQFIEAAQQSASEIQTQGNVGAPKQLDNISLENAPSESVSIADSFLAPHLQDSSDSTGADLIISAGDFSYDKQGVKLRLRLHNTSYFVINTARVALSLHLNHNERAQAQVLDLPLPLDKPLQIGEVRVVVVNVPGEDWASDDVKMAEVRQIVAKMMTVSDAEKGIDYPQISKAVKLKEKKSTRLAPVIERENIEQDTNDEPDQAHREAITEFSSVPIAESGAKNSPVFEQEISKINEVKTESLREPTILMPQ